MTAQPDLANLRFGIAETEDERHAVYRLRYDGSVEEMPRSAVL